MFLSPSFASLAAAAPAAGAPSLLIQFLPFILIFVVFYFLLIRPQQQKMKQHRDMIANLRRGDEVITQGGMIGKVTRLADNEATIEVADGVRIKVIKGTIAEVRARTEPPKAAGNDDGDAEDDAGKDA